MRILLLASLAAAVLSCASRRRQLWTYAVIGIPTIASGAVWWATDSTMARSIYLLSSAACCLFVAVLILREVMRAERVSADTIYGSLAVYLLLGLLWGLVFTVQEVHARGSFDFGVRGSPTGDIDLLRDMIGFSYTTITTLGYGNIAPANPRADALATLEAIVGQIYLTVLVARLVGIQVSQSMQRS